MQKPPLIMGILNVTPDSFSDGGLYRDRESALRRAELMAREGADIIDVGGQSTRPGSEEVSVEEEVERTAGVIEAISSQIPVKISIDTMKFEVANEAVHQGATILNDLSGGRDPRMADLASKKGLEYILMHMQGTPATMQRDPQYPRGVLTEVKEFLKQRVAHLVEAGVPQNKIWVDPGIGFGKLLEHNLELLRHLDELSPLGERVVIGTSRKSFLALLAGDQKLPFELRLPGAIASNLWAYSKGASVFRIHDVGEFKRALTTWRQIADGGY